MQTAIVSVVCIALIVVGGMTMGQGFLASADSTSVAVKEMCLTEAQIARTGLDIVGATTLFQADHLRVRVRNSGQTKLVNFSKWDFFVQYYDGGGSYHVEWLPYTDGALGSNQWKRVEICVEAGGNILPDVYDPGILNPGEEMLIDAKLSPAPQGGTAVDVTVSTPNGVCESVAFAAGETILTAHSATKAIAGTGYYVLEEGTPADGTAMTETTDSFNTEETGRKILHQESDASRPARHVLPLTGIAGIPAGTWTVYYQARTWGDGNFPEHLGDARVNLDVVIRKADGSIRDTIATGVAGANITAPEIWETISATYDFPGYTVVDDTDYLEVVYYGRSAGDGPPNFPACIQLRVDDSGLAQTDQTRIET